MSKRAKLTLRPDVTLTMTADPRGFFEFTETTKGGLKHTIYMSANKASQVIDWVSEKYNKMQRSQDPIEAHIFTKTKGGE